MNIDDKTVQSFGKEWTRFDQTEVSKTELSIIFEEYFSIFPWEKLSENSEGFDMGCGSGRWAQFVASRVGHLNCIDPSEALLIAKQNLKGFENISFFQSSVGSVELAVESQDFGYSLGVLHHVPDTQAAIESCVELLKPGAPLLLYLYYRFDSRPWWFKGLWKISDIVRKIIFRLPDKAKYLVTDLIAFFIYWPTCRLIELISILGLPVRNIPLSYYKDKSLYTMRTDSRDRFGTPLEKRYLREEIEKMMIEAGLSQINFSERPPFWCVVGVKN